MEDITGKKFGFLTVKEFVGYKKRRPFYKVVCDCGTEKEVCYWELVRGHSRSCGCLHRKMVGDMARKHGESKTRLFKIWCGIKKRCLDQKSTRYSYYGGRGIKICDEWKNDFIPFRDWAQANGYTDELTIDRIDVNGDYCPENCQWATKEQQANNTRSNHYLEYKGVKHSMSEWCKILGLNYNTIRGRINSYHWTVEEAFEK